MVFWHKPSARAAAFFGVQGCVAGDVLAAVQPEGNLTGCSFLSQSAGKSAREAWPTAFAEIRGYARNAPEPCASCEYLKLCRGGCRAVSQAHGALLDPDPGCPRVQQYRHPLPVLAT
jgi:radical SAM protein with 4Fe4S-binding SPASM domain